MNKKEIESALRNYYWMVKEIARLRAILEDAGENIVRQLDEDADMPKPKGKVSDPVYLETVRREKHWRRIEKLERKVKFIQENIDCITDDRERTVLDCMLDGMTLVAIALHLGTSEKQVRRIKDSIVDRIAENAENADFAENAEMLHAE